MLGGGGSAQILDDADLAQTRHVLYVIWRRGPRGKCHFVDAPSVGKWFMKLVSLGSTTEDA